MSSWYEVATFLSSIVTVLLSIDSLVLIAAVSFNNIDCVNSIWFKSWRFISCSYSFNKGELNN